MAIDLALAIGIAMFFSGGLTGWLARSKRLARRTGFGLIVLLGIGLAIATWVVLTVDRWESGGTIPKYHAGRHLWGPLPTIFQDLSIGLFYLSPLALGVVTGAACAFRDEKHGWLRLAICSAAVPCVFIATLWMMTVATT